MPQPKFSQPQKSTYSHLYKRPGNERYVSHCWNCQHPINEDKDYSPVKCPKCNKYHCRKCGACFCGKPL